MTPLQIIRSMGRTHLGTIHVGANTGQEIPEYREAGIPWAVLIEPLDGPFGQLKKAIGDDPKMLAVQALCSSEAGVEHDFHVSSNGGESSSLLKPAQHLVAAPAVAFPTTIKLISSTLDLIVADLEASVAGFSMDQVDILTMDVQGAELHVLKGGSRTLQKMRYVCAEVSVGGLYENDASLDDIMAFLTCYGFRLIHLNINRFGWGDAVFMK